MAALPVKKQKTDNVIELRVVNGSVEKKPNVRYTKDGSVDKRYGNSVSVAGVSKEVYAFTTKEELDAMVGVFDKHIEEAPDENKKQIARRNKMLFLIGSNVGLRASDLCSLTYGFFMNDDGTFKNTDKEPLKLQPKKTKKTKKFVPVHINNTVKSAIENYIKYYPIQNMDEYLFKSRKGDNHISEKTLWDIINKTAIEAGIEQNIGSHSLRKTFGYWAWHNAKDKNEMLINLQKIFNHSSPQTTMIYIGLLNTEIKNVFDSLDSVFDY